MHLSQQLTWLLLHIAHVLCEIWQPHIRDHRPLAQAAIHVIKRYISPRSSTLVIKENCVTCVSEHVHFHSRLLNYMLRNLDDSMSLQLYLGAPNEQPWDYNVFIVDSLESFKKLRFHFSDTLYDREFYFLIVFTYRILEERDWNIKEIFVTCMHVNVLNAMILVEEAPAIVFYSYKLFGPKCDRDISVHVTNRYLHGQLTNDMLFAPHFSNLYNCPLNISWYELPPFAMFDGNTSDPSQLEDETRLKGIDGELLQILAKVLHFRITLLEPCEKSFIDATGNATGCFLQLQQDYADISLGGLSGSHYMRYYFSTTVAYHQSSYVFIVRSDYIFGPIAHLVSPFTNPVWCIIMGIFLLAILMQKRYGFCRQNLLFLWTTFLGNPVEERVLPRKNFARYVLICWLLMALVLRSVYQGKLFDRIRVPRFTPVPRYIYELYDQNYTLVASDYVEFFERNRTLIMPTSYMKRFKVIDDAASHDKKLTTLALLGNLVHYNYLYWETSTLTYVQEPIYLYQTVMYLRKHSILKFVFDMKIKQLMMAGLVSELTNRYEYQKLIYLDQNRRIIPPITVHMNCNIFRIYYTVLGCVCLVFIGELIVSHFQ